MSVGISTVDILIDIPRKSLVARMTNRRGETTYEVGYTSADFDPEEPLPAPPPEVPAGYSAALITEWFPGGGPLGSDLWEYVVSYERESAGRD